MANEFDTALKNIAASVAQYVKDASMMQVETRYVEIGEKGSADFAIPYRTARENISTSGSKSAVRSSLRLRSLPMAWSSCAKAAVNCVRSWGLADWYAVEETPVALINTPAHVHFADIVSYTATMLGKTDEAERYAAIAARLRQTLNRKFLDPATGIYGQLGWKVVRCNAPKPLEELHACWWTGDCPCTQAGQVLALAGILCVFLLILVCVGTFWLYRYFGEAYYGRRGAARWALFGALLAITLKLPDGLLPESFWLVRDVIWIFSPFIAFFIARWIFPLAAS